MAPIVIPTRHRWWVSLEVWWLLLASIGGCVVAVAGSNWFNGLCVCGLVDGLCLCVCEALLMV